MLGTLLKVNTLAILNSSATAISWSVAIENDNINSTKSCTLEKVIISYICNDSITGSLLGAYTIVGR
jgi:acid phosphatase class B